MLLLSLSAILLYIKKLVISNVVKKLKKNSKKFNQNVLIFNKNVSLSSFYSIMCFFLSCSGLTLQNIVFSKILTKAF